MLVAAGFHRTRGRDRGFWRGKILEASKQAALRTREVQVCAEHRHEIVRLNSIIRHNGPRHEAEQQTDWTDTGKLLLGGAHISWKDRLRISVKTKKAKNNTSIEHKEERVRELWATLRDKVKAKRGPTFNAVQV